MKLRIKSHSIRFRISSEELAQLGDAGIVEDKSIIPAGAPGSPVVQLTYSVRCAAPGDTSWIEVVPFGFHLYLSLADCTELVQGEGKGVYVRREWENDQGHVIRFVAYVEKDKKDRRHRHAIDVLLDKNEHDSTETRPL